MGITVDGLDGLLLSLEEIMDLPDAVAREMLEAEAEIVEEAQRRTGEAMGVHRTGATLDAIGHTGMKRGPDGTRSLSVSLRGTNAKGVRNAEVAFLNEYGVPGRGIPARGFRKKSRGLLPGPALYSWSFANAILSSNSTISCLV